MMFVYKEIRVYAIYFDEVKYNPPDQKSYWIGGLAIPIDRIPVLEAQVNDLAFGLFEDRSLRKETEFHGKEMFNGKANFKGMDFVRRLDAMKSLVKIIEGAEDVQKIYVRIVPENIIYSADKPESIAFRYFLEQVDKFLADKATKGMIFGDKDDDAVATAVECLALYKQSGTGWAKGRKIENIVDTPHFARSHHSRMIQLADIFVYVIQFLWSTIEGSANREQFRSYLRIETNLQYICQGRVWPSEPYWHR
jgi:hypothetical protein